MQKCLVISKKSSTFAAAKGYSLSHLRAKVLHFCDIRKYF